MPVMDNILEAEYSKIRKRYNLAYEDLARLSADRNKTVRELVKRLLTSRVLHFAAGSVTSKYGYSHAIYDSPLNRMEWVVFFVGHEILDDGDPALAWHRMDHDGSLIEKLDCKKTDEGAMPYWHCCQEITAKKWEDRAEHLTPELAIWTLDYYEEREEERIKMIMSFRDEDYFIIEPKDQLMESLALSLSEL